MTAGAFDRLLYTDCRAGTGRGAGGGFQVQAQSAGVDGGQSKLAVGWLLYDAPNAWIVAQRPVADFPLGFAHAAGDGYGTAQSRYVGTEATGSRQGNHLADCLLTRDADLYGPTRPAQLWRSPLWRSEAWETTECPALTETPPPGPLTVDSVTQWLRARPGRAAVLARLVSVLEDPAGRRVVITAGGPDEAMTWIAAATLLLPARDALQVSFKVFCPNPQWGEHRIVAVPRDLNPQVAPGRGESAFVLDADEAVSDEAEVSARASFWTGLLAAVEDPYDVVDAVELAGQLNAGQPRDWPEARLTAWALTAPDDAEVHPRDLYQWLTTADPEPLKEHGPPVARRIMAAGAPAAVLRWIDDAASRGCIEVNREAVRGQLLTAEIAEVRAGGTPPQDALVKVVTNVSNRRDADSELSSAIVLGSDAEVDLLLRLARRHGVRLQMAPLQSRLGEFTARWIDDPAADHDPAQWALREEILDQAHDQLQLRFAAGGTPWARSALPRLWRHFTSRPGDLADELDCYLQVAAIREVPSDRRPARVQTLLKRVSQAPGARDGLAAIQQALIDWALVGQLEACVLLRNLPRSVPLDRLVLDRVMDRMEGTAEAKPTAQLLDDLALLSLRGLAPQQAPFAGLASADQGVLRFIEATRTVKFQKDRAYAGTLVGQLRQVEPLVLRARLPLLLRTCLEYHDPGLGTGVLGVLPPPQHEDMITLWARELGGQLGIRAAVWGVYWATDPKLEDLRGAIATAFRDYGAALSPEDREKWIAAVRRDVGPDQAANWTELAEGRSLLGRLFRGKGA